jgi:hypothetical protein
MGFHLPDSHDTVIQVVRNPEPLPVQSEPIDPSLTHKLPDARLVLSHRFPKLYRFRSTLWIKGH